MAVQRRRPAAAGAAAAPPAAAEKEPAAPAHSQPRKPSSLLRVVAERLVIVLFVLHMLLVFFCYSPGLQAEALFLHRASWVWPPCSLDHPERGAAISWLPRTSELLQLAEDQPRTEAHRLQGEAGGLGLWLTRPDPACSTGGAWVLHLHGNGESRCWAKTARKAALLAAPPFCAHVATPDYRGFGDSDGSPYNHSDDQPAQPASAADLVADARIALRWLRQRRQADSGGEGPLVLYGHSLGSHVALALAAEETCPTTGGGAEAQGGGGGGGGGGAAAQGGGVAALLLEGAFTAPAQVAFSYVPWPLRSLVWKHLSRVYSAGIMDGGASAHYRGGGSGGGGGQFALDSVSLASQLCPALPVFQCHGARDWSVPLRLGEVLHERTRARPGRAAEARFARAAQGGHDVLEDVRSELEAFWAAEVVRAAS